MDQYAGLRGSPEYPGQNRITYSPPEATAAPPTVTDVLVQTGEMLHEANSRLEKLLVRVRGSLPMVNGSLEKDADRGLVTTADRLATAANLLREQISELERVL